MVLLANIYRDSIDPTGWYCSEKMDGIRMVFRDGKLYSRNNNVIHAPDWFVKDLPKSIPLDGELWTKRGDFANLISIVSSGKTDRRWDQVSYMVFDIPEPSAGIVEERWDAIEKLLAYVNKSNIQYLPQTICNSKEHLLKIFNLVIKNNGEGLMLRKPRSIYENGRSNSLLKLKKFYDAEATVIGYQESEITTKGKFHLVGSMGALLCRTDDGIKVKVGTGFDDSNRLCPPPIGSRITFKYQEILKSGSYRHPVFLRMKLNE